MLYEIEFAFPRDRNLSVYDCCSCARIHLEHCADAKMSAPEKKVFGINLAPLGLTAVPVPSAGYFSHRSSAHCELAIDTESDLQNLAHGMCAGAAQGRLRVASVTVADMRSYKRARVQQSDPEWRTFLDARESERWEKF